MKFQKIARAVSACLMLLASATLAFAEDDSRVTQIVSKPGFCLSSYFGFSLYFPDDWTLITPRSSHQFQEAGGDALVRDHVFSRDVVNADQANTHSLVEIRSPLDSSSSYNPNIRMVAEGLHNGAPFTTAEGYIAYTAKLLSAIQMPKYQILQSPRLIHLGGQEFYRAKFEGKMADSTVVQLYYARFIRGYVFSIVVSAGDEDELAQADHILQKIEFASSQ